MSTTKKARSTPPLPVRVFVVSAFSDVATADVTTADFLSPPLVPASRFSPSTDPTLFSLVEKVAEEQV